MNVEEEWVRMQRINDSIFKWLFALRIPPMLVNGREAP